jgi:AcrR family transcriptional regulator
MLDTGRDLALEAGVGLSLEDLGMEEVIQKAGVPRSSVYRLWPYKDDFMDDLLCHLAGPGSWFAGEGTFDPETFTAIQAILAENADLLATAEGRRGLLREIVRVAVGRNYTSAAANLRWRIHVALIATVGSTRRAELRERIASTLEQTQSYSRRTMATAYGNLMAVLGLRPRDETRTVEHLITATAALIQGMALRKTLVDAALGEPGELPEDSEVVTSDRLLNGPVPGPGLRGEPVEWTLAALAYLALVDSFLEPDPEFTVTP